MCCDVLWLLLWHVTYTDRQWCSVWNLWQHRKVQVTSFEFSSPAMFVPKGFRNILATLCIVIYCHNQCKHLPRSHWIYHTKELFRFGQNSWNSKPVSQITKPKLGMFVLKMNAFLMAISNVVTKIQNFDIFSNILCAFFTCRLLTPAAW